MHEMTPAPSIWYMCVCVYFTDGAGNSLGGFICPRFGTITERFHAHHRSTPDEDAINSALNEPTLNKQTGE